jgi:hypothetical protein
MVLFIALSLLSSLLKQHCHTVRSPGPGSRPRFNDHASSLPTISPLDVELECLWNMQSFLGRCFGRIMSEYSMTRRTCGHIPTSRS